MTLHPRGAAATALTALALLLGAMTPATAATRAYTMAQVKTHKSTSNCWTAVNGKVYNVTKWITRHPGGERVIKAMCGKDATAAFKAQHGLKGGEASRLATFQVGTLKKVSATGSTSATLTAALVATHNTATNCWTIVNGNVYNVTSWVDQHPGGASKIAAMCGMDATAAFSAQHGLRSREAGTLAGFLLGALGAPAPTA